MRKCIFVDTKLILNCNALGQRWLPSIFLFHVQETIQDIFGFERAGLYGKLAKSLPAAG